MAGRSEIAKTYTEGQDEIHASAIYSTLENEIVPMYYEHRDQGVPVEWVRRMKTSIAHITPQFSAGRMVAEYMSDLYVPAQKEWTKASADDFAVARQKTVWEARIQEAWSNVKFLEVSAGPDHTILNGSLLPLRAVADLGGLQPSEVRVEAIIGRIGVTGQLEDSKTVPLAAVEQKGEAFVFTSQYQIRETGRLGFSMRISPNHFENPLTRPCNAPLKWVSE